MLSLREFPCMDPIECPVHWDITFNRSASLTDQERALRRGKFILDMRQV